MGLCVASLRSLSRQFGRVHSVTGVGAGAAPPCGSDSSEQLIGTRTPHSGHSTHLWYPNRVSAIDPVGLTNASTADSLSRRQRTTRKGTVLSAPRTGSAGP